MIESFRGNLQKGSPDKKEFNPAFVKKEVRAYELKQGSPEWIAQIQKEKKEGVINDPKILMEQKRRMDSGKVAKESLEDTLNKTLSKEDLEKYFENVKSKDN